MIAVLRSEVNLTILEQRVTQLIQNKPRLYLDDLSVGQKFISAAFRMTDEKIKSFAMEFDPQPFHLDDAAAQASIFGGLAASGWHTAAVAMRLLVDGGLPLGNGIIGLGGDLAWPKPTRPGDTCTWKAKSWKSHLHVPSQTRPSSRCAAPH
jgi:acyl dehydratase